MISLRLAVPAVLVAAAVAACFAYFVTTPPPVEADQQLSPAGKMSEVDLGTMNIDQRPSAEDRADTFRQAAEAILKQTPNAHASADEPPITGHVPLPKRRPIRPKEIPPAKPNG
jgi:hypothetical protein